MEFSDRSGLPCHREPDNWPLRRGVAEGASRPTELPFSWGVPILAMLAGILLRAAALVAAGQPLSIASLVQAYCRWDCDHYMSIARQGYGAGINEAGGADWAFFPLVPLATSAIVKLTALSFPSAGTLAALLATFGASRPDPPLGNSRGRALEGTSRCQEGRGFLSTES